MRSLRMGRWRSPISCRGSTTFRSRSGASSPTDDVALPARSEVKDWTVDSAEHYADIRANLKVRGEMIGANDLLIAAHGRRLDAVLVTNNVGEFGRVKKLEIENWSLS